MRERRSVCGDIFEDAREGWSLFIQAGVYTQRTSAVSLYLAFSLCHCPLSSAEKWPAPFPP
jgi:hypothetical protein